MSKWNLVLSPALGFCVRRRIIFLKKIKQKPFIDKRQSSPVSRDRGPRGALCTSVPDLHQVYKSVAQRP